MRASHYRNDVGIVRARFFEEEPWPWTLHSGGESGTGCGTNLLEWPPCRDCKRDDRN